LNSYLAHQHSLKNISIQCVVGLVTTHLSIVILHLKTKGLMLVDVVDAEQNGA